MTPQMPGKEDYFTKGTENSLSIWEKKKKTDLYHTPYTKVNYTWLKNLNIKVELYIFKNI